MRKYLAAAFFAAIPFGFFLANGLPEASAREGGFLGNLFSKRKAKECETPFVEPDNSCKNPGTQEGNTQA